MRLPDEEYAPLAPSRRRDETRSRCFKVCKIDLFAASVVYRNANRLYFSERRLALRIGACAKRCGRRASL